MLAAGQQTSPPANAALDQLCRTYWPPLFAYARRQGHGPHDAQDLTQGFFAYVLEKRYMELADRQKGKFRSFLLLAFKYFLGDERDRANAVKRGGGQVVLSLDEQMAEDMLPLAAGSDLSPEKEFEKNWAITLLRQALARLREESERAGKGPIFNKLKPFLEGEAKSGDYASVAAQLGMSPNGVAVGVHRLRQRYRELVRSEIAQTVATPEELEDEYRHLFSALAQ